MLYSAVLEQSPVLDSLSLESRVLDWPRLQIIVAVLESGTGIAHSLLTQTKPSDVTRRSKTSANFDLLEGKPAPNSGKTRCNLRASHWSLFLARLARSASKWIPWKPECASENVWMRLGISIPKIRLLSQAHHLLAVGVRLRSAELSYETSSRAVDARVFRVCQPPPARGKDLAQGVLKCEDDI